MSPWDRLLEKPLARGHFVQLYQRGDTSSLIRSISLYISEGLKRRQAAVTIATAEHHESLAKELEGVGLDMASAIRQGRLLCLDAQETMSRFIVAGQPDWYKFEAAMTAAVRRLRREQGPPAFRAYGEMVDLLWDARHFAAAIRLEQFWNKLLARWSFSLYCAYAVDVFDKKFDPASLDGVLCTHTHLLPSKSRGNLDDAVNLAMDEVLGVQAKNLRHQLKTQDTSLWAAMPHGENTILRLRKMIPSQAEQIIERAREYYEQSLRGLEPVFTPD
ncbi:MAG TPA: MEDS domain-containing protein [Bryobacteraceae bacterium]|nr:MEDS domain-containing protein [Bryobacteraceae bacterium]